MFLRRPWTDVAGVIRKFQVVHGCPSAVKVPKTVMVECLVIIINYFIRGHRLVRVLSENEAS